VLKKIFASGANANTGSV